MKTKYIILLLAPLFLSSCSLSLSPEKAATTTVSPQDIQQAVDSQPEISPTTTPDPLDNKDLSDQDLLDTLDDLDSLDFDSDIKELDAQL